jgi:hypothetical protein
MKNLVLFGIFVLLLVAVQFAGGQTIDEIIEKHIRAKGGLDKIAAIQDIYMEGLITWMGITACIRISKKQNDLNPSGFNMQWLITESEVNYLIPENSLKDTVLVVEIMAELQDVPDISAHLTNYAGKGYTAVLIGKETVDDTTCYHIQLNMKDKNEIHYWISASGFLLEQSSIINSSIKAKEKNYTRYHNYKAADGILFAHSLDIQKKEGNQNYTCELFFNTISINQPFDSNFVKPVYQT